MVARVLTAPPLLAWAVLAALLVGVGCDAPSPAILRLSFTSITVGTSRTLVFDTDGCNPVFSVDLGTVEADPTATVQLDPGGRSLDAQRTGAEQFQATVPTDLAVGSYNVTLVLRDGRRAPYAGRLDVLGSDDPVLEQVDTPRWVVEPGEPAVPLAVRVFNPSHCTLDALHVAPRFLRQGSDDHSSFHADPQQVTLAPYTRQSVTFSIAVDPAAVAGEVVLDATAQDGRRTGGSDCAGAAGTTGGAEATARWVIVPGPRRVLEVTQLQASPREPVVGATFNVSVQVRNNGSVSLDLDDLVLTSAPVGVARRSVPMLSQRHLTPGGTGQFRLDAVSDETLDTSMPYVLAVEATAHDSANVLYATARTGPTLTVMLHDH